MRATHPPRGAVSAEVTAAWVAEMLAGAERIRTREDVPAELRGPVADHLRYAAGRLEVNPAATGPMTTGTLAIARAC